MVSGLPFPQGKTRRMPGDRLVAKMLCKGHNEDLSPLDAAAGHFFQVLKAFKHRGIMRARGAKKPGGIDVYRVDGSLVERWMLKTVINVTFGRHVTPADRWRPPESWVRCVFGRTPFPAKCGFYLLTGEANVVESSLSSLGVRLLTRSDDATVSLIGGQFRIEEMQFAVMMIPLHERHAGGYRTRVMRDKPSLDVRQVVNIEWKASTD